jgi:hypothetical protein
MLKIQCPSCRILQAYIRQKKKSYLLIVALLTKQAHKA